MALLILGAIVVALLVLLVGGWLWTRRAHGPSDAAATPDAPVTAAAQPHQLTSIFIGADGLHSTSHRTGEVHPETLTRPHGRAAATYYERVHVHGRTAVYQEMVG